MNFYANNPKSFECPADASKKNAWGTQGKGDKTFQLSYGFNGCFNATSNDDYGTCANTYPPLTCESPSITLLMADIGGGGTDDTDNHMAALRPYVASTTIEAADNLAFRHGDRFNIAFYDNHVETKNKSINAKDVTVIKMATASNDY